MILPYCRSLNPLKPYVIIINVTIIKWKGGEGISG
jgi:hypothetical protein